MQMQPDVGLAQKHKLDSDPWIQITIGENKKKKNSSSYATGISTTSVGGGKGDQIGQLHE